MRRLNSGDRTRPSQDSSSCQSVRPAHTLFLPPSISFSLPLMIAPIFICLFPLLPFSSFLFTAELEQNFQVQGCRKAAAQTTTTTTTTVATHPVPDSRGRGQWGLEAHKTRRQLCLPFLRPRTQNGCHRESERESQRENETERERERAQCRPPFCTCVRAAFPTHSGNILLTLSAHNFHTQNLLTCSRGGASGGGGAGRVGFVSVTWHCFPSLSLSPSLPLFFEYPEKHTQADASSTSPPPALPARGSVWLESF